MTKHALRKPLNQLLRSFRTTKQRLFPELQLSRLSPLRALRSYMFTAARLNYIDDIRGHKMYLDETDSLMLSHNRVYEEFETEFFQRELQPGQVVVDVGANIGYYTLIFARRVGPQGQVYAFEPDPTNFALLQKNVSLNSYRNVQLFNKALSSQPGVLRLYLSAENKGDHRAYDSHDDRPSIEIDAVRLDDILDQVNRPVDYIKMDIQGAEYYALAGMAGLLRSRESICLVTEFWPAGIKQSGCDPRALLDLLTDMGFRIYHIDDHNRAISEITSEQLLGGTLFTSRRHTNLLFRRGPYLPFRGGATQ